MIRAIRFYQTKNGKAPAEKYIRSLDRAVRARLAARLTKVQNGNLGDVRSVGAGVHELRFDAGPGYRIYFSVVSSSTVILLLVAGDKSTQSRDIEAAKASLRDYESRIEEFNKLWEN